MGRSTVYCSRQISRKWKGVPQEALAMICKYCGHIRCDLRTHVALAHHVCALLTMLLHSAHLWLTALSTACLQADGSGTIMSRMERRMVAMSQAQVSEATRLKRLRSRGGSDSSSMSLGSVSDPAFHVHSEDDSRGPTIVNQADNWTRDLANRRDETKQGKKVRRDAGIARAAAPVLAVLTQATVDAAVQQAEPRKANARTCGDDAVAAIMDEPRSVPNATRDAAMRSTTQGGGTNP